MLILMKTISQLNAHIGIHIVVPLHNLIHENQHFLGLWELHPRQIIWEVYSLLPTHKMQLTSWRKKSFLIYL